MSYSNSRQQATDLRRQAAVIADKAAVENRELTSAEFAKASAMLDHAERIESEQPQGMPAVIAEPNRGLVSPGRSRSWAVARGELRHELTYRPDQREGEGFFKDLLAVREGQPDARERLNRNRAEALDAHQAKTGVSYRDMNISSTSGGEFLPPIFLSDLYTLPGTGGRPLWDALPKYPMPERGHTITVPALTSGVSVAARAGTNAAVSETDGVTSNTTYSVNEYSGLIDVDRQQLLRSEPGFDLVSQRMLMKRYENAVDVDLFSGSGTDPHHKGLDNISPNTVTFTSSTPTGAGILPLVYESISSIYEQRSGEAQADIICMHGRRAAWIGYQTLTSATPLVQQSDLFLAFGSQNAGFTEMFAGLQIVKDPNITTVAGNPGTNQDKIYILSSSDFYVSESPLYARVHEGVGSGTGTIRLALFGFSAFLSSRYPKSCTIISGTGLATPTWS